MAISWRSPAVHFMLILGVIALVVPLWLPRHERPEEAPGKSLLASPIRDVCLDDVMLGMGKKEVLEVKGTPREREGAWWYYFSRKKSASVYFRGGRVVYVDGTQLSTNKGKIIESGMTRQTVLDVVGVSDRSEALDERFSWLSKDETYDRLQRCSRIHIKYARVPGPERVDSIVLYYH